MNILETIIIALKILIKFVLNMSASEIISICLGVISVILGLLSFFLVIHYERWKPRRKEEEVLKYIFTSFNELYEPFIGKWSFFKKELENKDLIMFNISSFSFFEKKEDYSPSEKLKFKIKNNENLFSIINNNSFQEKTLYILNLLINLKFCKKYSTFEDKQKFVYHKMEFEKLFEERNNIISDIIINKKNDFQTRQYLNTKNIKICTRVYLFINDMKNDDYETFMVGKVLITLENVESFRMLYKDEEEKFSKEKTLDFVSFSKKIEIFLKEIYLAYEKIYEINFKKEDMNEEIKKNDDLMMKMFIEIGSTISFLKILKKEKNENLKNEILKKEENLIISKNKINEFLKSDKIERYSFIKSVLPNVFNDKNINKSNQQKKT